MVIQNSLFGIDELINDAINLLRKHEPPEGYYLCFSGGKDSVVVHDLAVRAGVKFDAHHNITTVEPPELMKFIRDNYPDVINEHPKISMYSLIVKKRMLPLRKSRYCCEYLKEHGGQGRIKITGIRSAESSRRAKRERVEIDKQGGLFVHPIKLWSTETIWEYIHLRGLKYCRLYDDGFHRIGCVLCPYGKYSSALREIDRYPQFVAMYKRACNKLYEINKDRLQNHKWTSGEDMFNWWIEGRKWHDVIADCNSIPLFSEDDGMIL